MIRAKKNERVRPGDSQKSVNAFQFSLSSKFKIGQQSVNLDSDQEFGAFGFRWSQLVKGNQKALPSLVEIVFGLHIFYCKYVDENFRGQSRENIDAVKENYKKVFDFMLHSVNCPDVDLPLIGQYDKRTGSDVDLFNPDGKAVCLILYLYTLEPPFYYYLNKASRFMLDSELTTLGPFARALHEILSGAEGKREDKIIEGKDKTSDVPV